MIEEQSTAVASDLEGWLRGALAMGFAIVAQETPQGLTYTPCTSVGVELLRREGGVSHVFWPKGADRYSHHIKRWLKGEPRSAITRKRPRPPRQFIEGGGSRPCAFVLNDSHKHD